MPQSAIATTASMPTEPCASARASFQVSFKELGVEGGFMSLAIRPPFRNKGQIAQNLELAWSERSWHKNLAKTLIWPRPLGQTVRPIATGPGRLAFENA